MKQTNVDFVIIKKRHFRNANSHAHVGFESVEGCVVKSHTNFSSRRIRWEGSWFSLCGVAYIMNTFIRWAQVFVIQEEFQRNSYNVPPHLAGLLFGQSLGVPHLLGWEQTSVQIMSSSQLRRCCDYQRNWSIETCGFETTDWIKKQDFAHFPTPSIIPMSPLLPPSTISQLYRGL